MRTSNKSLTVYMLLGFLLGGFGLHRFYVGKVFTGLLYLVTFGLMGIGILYDGLVLVFGTPRDAEGLSLGASAPSKAATASVEVGDTVYDDGEECFFTVFWVGSRRGEYRFGARNKQLGLVAWGCAQTGDIDEVEED